MKYWQQCLKIVLLEEGGDTIKLFSFAIIMDPLHQLYRTIRQLSEALASCLALLSPLSSRLLYSSEQHNRKACVFTGTGTLLGWLGGVRRWNRYNFFKILNQLYTKINFSPTYFSCPKLIRSTLVWFLIVNYHQESRLIYFDSPCFEMKWYGPEAVVSFE